jgi:hypothetical protein
MLTVLDSPNNFPGSYRAPQISDVITLHFRPSDTVAQNGIAIEINGVFLGWIRKVDIPIVSPYLINNSALGGVIQSRNSHPWANKGGQNWSGTVVI